MESYDNYLRRLEQAKKLFGCLLAILVFILAVTGRRELFYSSGKLYLSRVIAFPVIWLITTGIILYKSLPAGGWPYHAVRVLYALLSPVYIFLAGECMTSGGNGTGNLFVRAFGTAAAKPDKFFINVLLIALIVLLFTGLTGSLFFGPWLAAAICILFCAANIYVKIFRGNAITAADLTTLSTAANVASGYTLTPRPDIFEGVLLLYFFTGAGLKLGPCGITAGFRSRLAVAFLSVALFAAGLRAFVFSDWLEEKGIRISYFDTMKSYRYHGTAAVFARSLGAVFPEKPDGYSPEAALEIARKYSEEACLPKENTSSLSLFSDDERSDSALPVFRTTGRGSLETELRKEEKTQITPEADTQHAVLPASRAPNVIVIINESFADMELTGEFAVSEDPMPFLHSLQKDCISGITYASVYGGMTANTEFEFLTNCTMGLLNASTVPFQIYLRSPHPSMATWMKTLGYTGIAAFHPHKAHNYRRDKAYPMLGFTEFYHMENVPVPLIQVRGFASDLSDIDNVIAIYEKSRESSSSPFFFYNMTVQNHSPYDVDEAEYPVTVHAQGLKRAYTDVDQYLTLIKSSDEALKKLITYFEAVDEPTVILFMGDHQPALDDRFIAEISGKARSDRNAEENMILYQVPYLIWANSDSELPREAPARTSMNYMQTNLLRSFGGQLTGFQKFLSELQNDIPVICAHGYWGNDGSFYKPDDSSSPYYGKYLEYAILQYNYLFDSANRLRGFFGE